MGPQGTGFDTVKRDLFIQAVVAEAIIAAAKGKSSVAAIAVGKLWDYRINQFLAYMFDNQEVDKNAHAFIQWLCHEGPMPEFYSHYWNTYGKDMYERKED